MEVKEGPDAGTNPVNTGYIKVATFSKQTAEGVKAGHQSLASSRCDQVMHPSTIPSACPLAAPGCSALTSALPVTLAVLADLRVPLVCLLPDAVSNLEHGQPHKPCVLL